MWICFCSEMDTCVPLLQSCLRCSWKGFQSAVAERREHLGGKTQLCFLQTMWLCWHFQAVTFSVASDGSQPWGHEREMASPALMRTLLWSVVVKKKLSWKVKFFIYWPDLASEIEWLPRTLAPAAPRQNKSAELFEKLIKVPFWCITSEVVWVVWPTGRKP